MRGARRSLRAYRAFGLELAVTLALAVALALALRAAAAGRGDTTAAPRPFQTGANLLIVDFTVYAAAPPRIDAVREIERGRLTILREGDNYLQVRAADGTVLYQVAFAVEFQTTSHSATPLASVRYSVIVPHDPAARDIIVVSRAGTATWPLAVE